MSLLLDTHFLVWLATEVDELTPLESALLDENADALYVSAISIWELRLKWNARNRLGERKGVLAPEAGLDFIAATRLQLVPLTGEDCVGALHPPIRIKDPFDEMLLVHAERLGARLLTRDGKMRGHPIAISP